MADNVNFVTPTGKAAADEVTYSGDTAKVQLIRQVVTTGAEGSKTVIDMAIGSGAMNTGTPRVCLATDSPGIAATVSHGVADSGDPLKVGGRARSSEITALVNNNRSDFLTDLAGKLLVLPYANPENFVSGCISTAMTGTTSTSLVAAPATGLRNYITTITASCAHATQGTDILIQDGSGGTTIWVVPAAALYGGAALTFPTPLRQPTTATALYAANVTTGSSTKISASGYKGV